MGLAGLVRAARGAARMTQEQLGEAIGFDQTTVSLIETGKTKRPSDAVLAGLARALGKSKAEIYEAAGLIEPVDCAQAPAPLSAEALAEALMDDEPSRAWLAGERVRRGPDGYRVLCEGIVGVSRGAARVAISLREGD